MAAIVAKALLGGTLLLASAGATEGEVTRDTRVTAPRPVAGVVAQASVIDLITPQIVRESLTGVDPRQRAQEFMQLVSNDPSFTPIAMRAAPNATRTPTGQSGDCALPISADQQAAQVLPRKAFEIGDKLKITFYEQVEDVGNKWKTGGTPGKSFQQFTELSGEYTVQEDGTVALPLLGTMAVGNAQLKDLQATMADAFQQLTGRKGYVTVASLERPPIYVLGPVKTPGSYKFTPGMTVLHSIAIAGGYDKQGVEPWQKIEVVREQAKRYGGLESISDLLVRATVLKAERDKATPVPPPQLVELVGDAKARMLIAAEADKRMAIVAARRSQDSAITQSINFAQVEVDSYANRLAPIDRMIEIRKTRSVGVHDLAARGVQSKVMAAQAQADVIEAENKRQEIVNQTQQAQQRLSSLKQEQARLDAQVRGEIETGILAIEQQIATTSRDTEASAGVLGALKVKFGENPASTAKGYSYEVVRQTAKGPVAFPSQGMTVLNPGDLVRIVSPDDTTGTPIGVPPAGPTNTGVRNASASGCR